MMYTINLADVQPKGSKPFLFDFPAYMGVSVTNPIFWGEDMAALLNWLDGSFPSCLIIIADHLHRINEYIFNGKTGEYAIEESLAIGNDLEMAIQNEIDTQNLRNIELRRWKYYYDNEVCAETKQFLFEVMETSENFREAVYDSCRSFINRLLSRGVAITVSVEDAVLLSSQYLIEEMAVFSYLIGEGRKTQIYPGPTVKVLKRIAAGEFPELNRTNLPNGIYIDVTVKKTQ